MTDSTPTENELAHAIESAAGTAIKKLFAEQPGCYYYVSLITTGEAHPPTLTAWSHEALEEAVKNAPDKDTARSDLKWSYGESPFFSYGEELFEPVRRLFDMRPDIHTMDDTAWEAEYELRLRAMETAMSRLDKQGIFGTGATRSSIVLNVEVMPPDYTNTERAMRLNPREALRAWLEEAAEME